MGETKIGYARVASTTMSKEQIDADLSIVAQIGKLKEAGCTEVFTDVGSAEISKRPGLNAALQKFGEGGTLLVCDLNRLTRSIEQKAKLLKELSGRGIKVQALAEPSIRTEEIGRISISER